MFPRHAKWAQHKREKLMNKAEGLKSEAMDRQDRDTQELFSSMSDEVRNMSNMCYVHGILENNSHPNSNIKNINSEINEDLDTIKSLDHNVITLAAMPPMLEKTPPSFVELLKECCKHEYYKFIEC